MERESSLELDEVEDLHICGTCRETFSNINLFVKHKKECKSKKTSNAADLELVQRNEEQKQTQTKTKKLKTKVKPISKTIVEIEDNNENVVIEPIDEIHVQCNDSEQTIESEEPEAIETTEKGENIKTGKSNNKKVTNEVEKGIKSMTTTTGTTMLYSNVIAENGKKYKCEFDSVCVFATYYLKDLERHYRIHTGEKPYNCLHCGRTFNRTDKLKLHERSHTGEKPYKCEDCSYASSDRSSLVKHQRIHTDERPYKCQICRYASRNSSQLVVHLRTHTGDAPFRCVLCPASFKINSDLKRHLRLHTGEKPFACDQCDYKCAIKGNLRMHIKLNHSDESLMNCNQCDFIASSKRLLKEHLREHTTKALRCDHCNYTTSSRSALNNHVRIHTNEKPYSCDVCGYSCRQACNLRTHIKKKHPEHEIGFIRKRKKSKSNVQIKGKTSNRGINRAYCQTIFPCHLCDCSFVREDSLRSHLRHHQDLMQTQTGAALAILQLQDSHVVNEEMVDVSIVEEKQIESIDDETEPQDAEFEVETTEKNSQQSSSKKNENTISVNSHLYQRLMQNNPQSKEQSPEIQHKIIRNKRGRPQKKSKHVTNQSHSLRLMTSQTATGQVLYQIPSGVRVVPYLSVNSNSNTVLVINGDRIISSHESVLPTSHDSDD